ncbi:hypothetical protein [Algoriphagus litoralis]|uniref:hypothetical protein n=1 Tax=Algoriphagus litoralis TaxID=2202829 RepID=UPI000DB90405|nr:hypothetical protein [Algoriphagus litoralis]
MNRLTNIPGKELFELHDPETIQKYLWEMHKGWMCYLSEHQEGEEPAERLFFFELLWNLISEQITLTATSKNEGV